MNTDHSDEERRTGVMHSRKAQRKMHHCVYASEEKVLLLLLLIFYFYYYCTRVLYVCMYAHNRFLRFKTHSSAPDKLLSIRRRSHPLPAPRNSGEWRFGDGRKTRETEKTASTRQSELI